jgi:hypothetical protein
MCRARFQSQNERVPPKAAGLTSFWRAAGFTQAMATFVLCCFRVPTHAEPLTWVPSPSPHTNQVSLDLELGLRARKALLQDEVLAGQPIGISVRNRIATLWGTASAPAVARRAEECLRNLPGLAAVRNDLYIDGRNTPPRPQSRTPGSQPQLPHPQRAPGALVHRAGEQTPAASQEFSWRPAQRRQTETLPGSADRFMPAKPSPESLPGFPTSDSIRIPSQARIRAEETPAVMPAMSLPITPPAANSARATLPSLPAGSREASGLAQAIEALRRADDRFRGVRVEVREDTVHLRGTVYRWEHLFELARSIARLPGVRHVLFDEIRAEVDP